MTRFSASAEPIPSPVATTMTASEVAMVPIESVAILALTLSKAALGQTRSAGFLAIRVRFRQPTSTGQTRWKVGVAPIPSFLAAGIRATASFRQPQPTV